MTVRCQGPSGHCQRSAPCEHACDLRIQFAGATASATGQRTFTLADMERLVRELEAMPQPPWTLIAPDGRAWQDADPQALLRVLAMAVYAISPFGVEGKTK